MNVYARMLEFFHTEYFPLGKNVINTMRLMVGIYSSSLTKNERNYSPSFQLSDSFFDGWLINDFRYPEIRKNFGLLSLSTGIFSFSRF